MLKFKKKKKSSLYCFYWNCKHKTCWVNWGGIIYMIRWCHTVNDTLDWKEVFTIAGVITVLDWLGFGGSYRFENLNSTSLSTAPQKSISWKLRKISHQIPPLKEFLKQSQNWRGKHTRNRNSCCTKTRLKTITSGSFCPNWKYFYQEDPFSWFPQIKVKNTCHFPTWCHIFHVRGY